MQSVQRARLASSRGHVQRASEAVQPLNHDTHNQSASTRLSTKRTFWKGMVISSVIFAGKPYRSQYGDRNSRLLSHLLAYPIPPRPIQVVLQLHRIFPRVEVRVFTLWDRHPEEFAQWPPTLVCSEL